MKNNQKHFLTAAAALLLALTTVLPSCAFVTMPPVSGPAHTADGTGTLPAPAESGEPNEQGGSAPDGTQAAEAAPNVTRTAWTLMPGTDTETPVYKYVTDKPGPKLIVVGGTHGDETAGWTAALELVAELDAQAVEGMCGEILVIPQLNILADNAVKRYVASHNGVAYSDLNRAFPVERAEDAAEASIALAEACIDTVRDFIGEDFAVTTDQEGLTSNLCIIDLHESRGAQSDGYLGNDLIYTNNAFLMESFLNYYNKTYRKTGEAKFVHDEATKSGSFSMYFSEIYPDAVVFTVETNRQVSGGADTIALTTRTRQQRNILNTLFDMVWNRVDKTLFD